MVRTAHESDNSGSSNSWDHWIQNPNVALGQLATQEWLSWDIPVQPGCGIPVVAQDTVPTTQHPNHLLRTCIYCLTYWLALPIQLWRWLWTPLPLHLQDMKSESDCMCVRPMGPKQQATTNCQRKQRRTPQSAALQKTLQSPLLLPLLPTHPQIMTQMNQMKLLPVGSIHTASQCSIGRLKVVQQMKRHSKSPVLLLSRSWSFQIKSMPTEQGSFLKWLWAVHSVHVLRAVRIRAALLTRTEAESEGRSRTQKWFSDGEHAEGWVWMRGSVSESINTLGGLEGLPA